MTTTQGTMAPAGEPIKIHGSPLRSTEEKIENLGPYKAKENVVIEGEWKGWYVGTCSTQSPIKTPTQSLIGVELTHQDAKRIAGLGDFTKGEFYLDVNSNKTGTFCYPYQNPVANKLLLDKPCSELFPSDKNDQRCELFKKGIEMMSGQQRALDWKEKASESFKRGLAEAPGGILNGFYFAVGMGIAAGLGLIKYIKHLFKNGNGGGPKGGSPTSSTPVLPPPPSEEPVRSDSAACLAASMVLGVVAVNVSGVNLLGRGVVFARDAFLGPGMAVIESNAMVAITTGIALFITPVSAFASGVKNKIANSSSIYDGSNFIREAVSDEASELIYFAINEVTPSDLWRNVKQLF